MLKESIYHWCTRQVTTVYLLTDATLQSVPRLHWFVYFCVMFQQNVDGSDRQNLFFPALIVPKPYPSPKLTNEKHILGMSTSPRNDLYFPKQCRLSCSLSQTPNTPRKYPFSVVFGTCKTTAQKFGNFSTAYACAHWFTFFFKNAHNRCMISGRKSALYW